MKEVSQYIRQSYLLGLNPLTVNGVVVPVKDERLGNTAPAVFGLGKAYVIIRDQLEQPTDANFCGIIQEASITLDVITKYPKGSGGKLLSEQISNEIQVKVNPFASQSLNIDSQFKILGVRKDYSNAIVEETETETVYRKIIIYINKINEK